MKIENNYTLYHSGASKKLWAKADVGIIVKNKINNI